MTAYNSMSSIPDLISSSVSLDLGKNDKIWLNQKYMFLVNVRKIVKMRSYYIWRELEIPLKIINT